ncbi:GTPase HflX [Candidatus Magnetaquicoccus inordinatus]|uniref:GTPase HflX n=1 Tax=Candidatus Magnetaquicoccus inordinatus TaxID=2496818 RepID=UPI001D0E996D|nr:GTPase HflX [Candidatus Magnetaquicoccus inordinatus]
MSTRMLLDTATPPDRAFLIQVTPAGRDRDYALLLAAELEHLAQGAGLQVVGSRLFSHRRVIPATFLGSGLVNELAEEVQATQSAVVVFNSPLSAVQQRNLEVKLNAKVVDRTGLILEIFAARARTREGRLQVELASMLYQQSRLVRSWTHLERQRGGVGMRGGPGETQIEVDRRLLRERVHQLKKQLTQVEQTRALQRQARREVPLFTVALVGYTNAGKSTLFNHLSGAHVEAVDRLFATLDPTLRQVILPGGGRIILGDTVGFIRDLPHQLVAAFRATLEEVLEADLLLHIVDLADPEWADQEAAVMEVLRELFQERGGVVEKRMLTLFNKIDQVDAPGLLERLRARPDTHLLSALTGEGIPELLQILETQANHSAPCFHLQLPVYEGALLARLIREGCVLQKTEEGETIHLVVTLPVAVAGRLRRELELFRAPAK